MELKNLPLINKISAAFRSQAQKPREETTETSVEAGLVSYYFQRTKLERTRLAKYTDYILMDDEYPEISTALDLYADNATKEKDDAGNPIEVASENSRVKNILIDLFDRTKINESLWDTARAIAKMGDEFDEVVVDSGKWIERLKNLDARTVFKNVDEFGREKEYPYVQKDETGSVDVAQFEGWQIIHWKNGGMKRMYGESILKPIRRVYKQLQMMEDGMVIGRLTRSHLRYKILIDVEGMEKDEREDYIKKVKNDLRKKRLVNPITGQLEITQNPLSAEEDFFIGVTKESKGDVGVLQGATNLGNIRDVEYFQNKLFTGLKVPKAFMGVEKDVKAKATIIEEDIQFARTVARLRKSLRIGLSQLADCQLMLRGITPVRGLYKFVFAPISMVDEMRKWTTEKLKADIAKIYKVDMSLLSDRYILKNFVGVPDEEIDVILREKPAPFISLSAKKGATPSLRAAGATGITTPAVGGLAQMVSQQDGPNGLDRNGFHIATMYMMNLVETLRDLVDLELNR